MHITSCIVAEATDDVPQVRLSKQGVHILVGVALLVVVER